MKVRYGTQIAITLLSCLAITGCTTFRPEKTDCSDRLSAPFEGMRSDLMTQQVDIPQPVAVRLNGVSAQCYVRNERVIMEVSAGLKVSRDLKEGIEPARVQVPFLISKVNADNQPYDTESLGFVMAFAKNREQLYPVAEFEIRLEQDARAIVALTPQIVETE